MDKTVLVVEDDASLVQVLEYNLRREGYQVEVARDGSQALEEARRNQPDLIILDIMLPRMDGFEVCRILRNEMNTPILMLNARDDEVDKIVGLEIGADDYMTKPFSMRELMARVRAMLRRAGMTKTKPSATGGQIAIDDLRIDISRRRVSRGDDVLNLTPKEFALLAYLASNRGIVFSREQLLEEVWGYDYAGDTRTVDVHIRWLRGKIESDTRNPRYIITVRGIGYKLEE